MQIETVARMPRVELSFLGSYVMSITLGLGILSGAEQASFLARILAYGAPSLQLQFSKKNTYNTNFSISFGPPKTARRDLSRNAIKIFMSTFTPPPP